MGFASGIAGPSRDLLVKGVIPFLGGLILLGAFIRSVYDDWKPDTGYTSWTLPFSPHWQIGGIFVLGIGAMALGVFLMLVWRAQAPAFFRGEVLTVDTPVQVAEDGLPPGRLTLPDSPTQQHLVLPPDDESS
jgi:hypothetical protein